MFSDIEVDFLELNALFSQSCGVICKILSNRILLLQQGNKNRYLQVHLFSAIRLENLFLMRKAQRL